MSEVCRAVSVIWRLERNASNDGSGRRRLPLQHSEEAQCRAERNARGTRRGAQGDSIVDLRRVDSREWIVESGECYVERGERGRRVPREEQTLLGLELLDALPEPVDERLLRTQ